MADRLFDVQYTRGQEMVIRIRPMRLRLFPEATLSHLRAANKELLLAARSFLDEAIQRVEEREKGRSQRRKKIPVTRTEAS